MDEYRLAFSGEHEVGLAGEFFRVKPITVSQAVDDLAYDQLRFGVLGMNRRHDERTLRRVDVIDHFTAGFLAREYPDQPWPVENLHHSW